VEVRFDAKDPLPRAKPFGEPAAKVHFLWSRAGFYSREGLGCKELPGPDALSPLSVFLFDDVTITPQK